MLDSYFDKIYVINLDSRPDRMEKVVEKFKSIGLGNYERVSAIKTNNGWEGCKASHLSIVKDAKDNNYKNFLVFEDDFILHTEFNDILTKSLDDLPDDWDMLYMGGNLSMCNSREKITENLIKVNSILTTHCYAMKNTLYDRTLSEANTIPPQKGFLRGQAIDVYYSEFLCKNNNVYLIQPMICFQEDGYSDIEKRHIDYKNIIK